MNHLEVGGGDDEHEFFSEWRQVYNRMQRNTKIRNRGLKAWCLLLVISCAVLVSAALFVDNFNIVMTVLCAVSACVGLSTLFLIASHIFVIDDSRKHEKYGKKYEEVVALYSGVTDFHERQKLMMQAYDEYLNDPGFRPTFEEMLSERSILATGYTVPVNSIEIN